MQKRTTIKDISKALGVNPSTVSRALRDHPDIGAELKQQIKNIAAELHYVPNVLASQLRQSASHTLALIIPEITMFFFPSVIRGITQMAREHGYQLMVLQSHEQLAHEIENIETCINHCVSGILISLCRETHQLDHLHRARQMGIPVVLFDKAHLQEDFDLIKIDDKKTAEKAVRFLIESGASQLLGIFGHPDLSISQLRRQGYEESCLKAGLTPTQFHAVHADSMEAAYAASRTALLNQSVNGIFAMSDEVISGVIPALTQQNIRVPDDCRVIGISDGQLPYFFNTPIDFLHHDGFRIGEAAALKLLEILEIGDVLATNSTIILDTPIKRNVHIDTA